MSHPYFLSSCDTPEKLAALTIFCEENGIWLHPVTSSEDSAIEEISFVEQEKPRRTNFHQFLSLWVPLVKERRLTHVALLNVMDIDWLWNGLEESRSLLTAEDWLYVCDKATELGSWRFSEHVIEEIRDVYGS